MSPYNFGLINKLNSLETDLTGTSNWTFKCDDTVDWICLKFLSQIWILRHFAPVSIFQRWV